jgi:hypothetical protein
LHARARKAKQGPPSRRNCSFRDCSAQAFASHALWPVFPAEHLWLLVWGVTPAAAALCLARGMEHAALLSALGNAAAALAAGGCAAYYFAALAAASWRGERLSSGAVAGSWAVDSQGGGSSGVPTPALALAAAASGFLIHFALPAVEAAMTSPRRVMEATSRGFGGAALALVVFGVLGASATGPAPPRVALESLGTGAAALVVRLAAAVDALTTVPVLCRPALLVAEGLFERATETKLRTPAAAALRCAFVGAAAAAAAGSGSGMFSLALPMASAAAALACALILPPLMLLVGVDADGQPLVRTSGVERVAAGGIACLGCCCVVFGGLAVAGAVVDVPFPYVSPPAPPAAAEYDYDGGYAAPVYAFTRAPVLDGGAGGTGNHSGAKAPVNETAVWANPASWNHSWVGQGGGAMAGGGAAGAASAAASAAAAASLVAAPVATDAALQGAMAAGAAASAGGAATDDTADAR